MPFAVTTYVKFMLGSYKFASRNRREVAVVSALGHSVAVSDVRDQMGVEHEGEVCVHHRRKRSHQNVWIRRTIILFDFLVRLPIHLRRFRSECLSCHDLIALAIGWLSTLGLRRGRRPHLVYDSHEYELGRNTAKPRGRLTLALIKLGEGFLIRRCAFVIAVNDSIADKLQEVHHLDRRPLVVRSTPNAWTLEPDEIRAQRKRLCLAMNVPPETFVTMYHGFIMRNRGIENFLQALVHVPGAAAVILGDGLPEYVNELESLAQTLGIQDRVHFHPAVPMAELKHFVAAADVGLVLFQAVYESYYYSLPNKLFENIQALTPVIGSDYPELSRIIDGYKIGLTVDPNDPIVIAAALNRMRSEEGLRATFISNLPNAKAVLSWEREQQVLHDAYLAILGKAVQPRA